MIDRYDAYMALRTFPLIDKRDQLVWGFQHETFYGIRNEIIKQLMENEEMYDLVNAKLPKEHPETVKFFIGNFNEIPQGFLYYYEKWLSHPSYDIVAMDLQKLYDNYPEKMSGYLDQTKNITGQNNNVRIKWLELACLSNYSREESLKTLVAFTSPAYEFRTRVSAFEALKRLNICDETIINNGYEALSSFNGRLSGPVKTVLDYFSQQAAFKKLMTQSYKKITDKKLKAVIKSNFGFLN
jgi:hypothetical protein